MAMTTEEIQNLIKESIPDATITIKDLRGDGDHYSATITSKSFLGKNKIEQHKMVYDSLKGKMGIELHALMIKTRSE
jgi:stress-induced morphogen